MRPPAATLLVFGLWLGTAARAWPAMRMPGFPEDVLGEADLDGIVASLGYLALRRDGAAR